MTTASRSPRFFPSAVVTRTNLPCKSTWKLSCHSQIPCSLVPSIELGPVSTSYLTNENGRLNAIGPAGQQQISFRTPLHVEIIPSWESESKEICYDKGLP